MRNAAMFPAGLILSMPMVMFLPLVLASYPWLIVRKTFH